MFHSRVHIEAGDIVIIFMSRENMTAIKVTPGEHFHNKFGRYKHDDMIGVKFGSKMHSPPPQSGYIHLLRPTPELWTLSLPHRTQILYIADIAYITQRLGIRVGGKVIEAGTGSGSMTHSLSRAVGPTGQVCSFEYHRPRYEKALEEFVDHDLKNVYLQHGNVCKDGFPNATDAEAIFLDLPAPWEAIPHAVKALRSDVVTRICCFSPCIEQVTKTASTLRDEGFTDVSTQEVLIRTYDLMAPPPPGSHHLKDVSSITQRLRDHEKRKEERRAVQMRNARHKARELKEREARQAATEEMANAEGSSSASATDSKIEHREKRKVEDEATPAVSKKLCTESGENAACDEEDDVELKEPTTSTIYNEPEVSWSSMVLTKPSPEMRGHTSYLTFATLYPAEIRANLNSQEASSALRARPGRVEQLVGGESAATSSATSEVATEYGDEWVESAVGQMTEEEVIALRG